LKSPAFVPVTVTPEIVSVAPPVLFSVTVCGALVVLVVWFPKVSDAGERETAAAVPVPVSGTLCGLPAALSVTLTFADRAPVAVGRNVTLIVQLLEGATLGVQLFVCVKSPLLVPAIATLETFSVPEPVFVRVTGVAALLVSMTWLPKDTLVGEKLVTAVAAAPVPLRATVCGLPAALSATLILALRAPVADGVKVTAMVHDPPADTPAAQLLV